MPLTTARRPVCAEGNTAADALSELLAELVDLAADGWAVNGEINTRPDAHSGQWVAEADVTKAVEVP